MSHRCELNNNKCVEINIHLIPINNWKHTVARVSLKMTVARRIYKKRHQAMHA